MELFQYWEAFSIENSVLLTFSIVTAIKALHPSINILSSNLLSLLYGVRQLRVQCFRQSDCSDPGQCGTQPHDQDRGGGPVDGEQVQEHGGDATYLGSESTHTHTLVPGAGGKQFCCIQIDNGKSCRSSKFSNKRQSQPGLRLIWEVVITEDSWDDTCYTWHYLTSWQYRSSAPFVNGQETENISWHFYCNAKIIHKWNFINKVELSPQKKILKHIIWQTGWSKWQTIVAECHTEELESHI